MTGSLRGVTDTGAQSCLWGLNDFYRSGFKKSDLTPVKQRLFAANRQPIDISGAIILRISGKTKGGGILEAPVMVYVSKDASNFYVSRQALVTLKVIHKNFPQIGSAEEPEMCSAVEPEVCKCP